MDFIEFLKNDGLEELTLPLITMDAEISVKIRLNYPGHMTASVTPADAMKFLHMFSTEDGEKYFVSANTEEELDFLKQSWNWIDRDQFQLGAKYEVGSFGLFIGIE